MTTISIKSTTKQKLEYYADENESIDSAINRLIDETKLNQINIDNSRSNIRITDTTLKRLQSLKDGTVSYNNVLLKLLDSIDD